MSDGPHRSLPMRPEWRRVAERGDKRAHTVEEIRCALAPALEQDCRSEASSEFLSSIRRVAGEPSLFKDDTAGRAQALRPEADHGIARAVLDYVGMPTTTRTDSLAVVHEALTAALIDRANRRARQVEEHYLRESSSLRASNIRRRLNEAIRSTDFGAIAARVLDGDSKRPPRTSLKKSGLDDGVSIR